MYSNWVYIDLKEYTFQRIHFTLLMSGCLLRYSDFPANAYTVLCIVSSYL